MAGRRSLFSLQVAVVRDCLLRTRRRGKDDHAVLPFYDGNSGERPDIQWKAMQGKMGMRLHRSVLSGL
jgi:hypothetical protein